MADVPVKPIILNDIDLKIAADNFEAHVSQVQFDPATTIVRWKGMTPASKFAASTGADWTCVLAYAQDWKTPNSLSRYLYEHQGEEIEVIFQPKAGALGPTWTATVIVAPGTIGGVVDAVGVGTVSLGVIGQPELA